MKVDVFTLCDSAQNYNGKLVIVGAYNNIHAPTFPLKHLDFSVVTRIAFDNTETGEHNLEISIKKNDAETCIVERKGMKGGIPYGKEEHITANLILDCKDITIPSEGTYIMTLKVDDKVFTSELYVNHGKPRQLP